MLAAALALGIGLVSTPSPSAKPGGARKRILFFTKSSGFEHSVIKTSGAEPSHAAGVLTELARARGWEVTHTKDGRIFTPESLATYGAVAFYTTGDLTTVGTDGHPAMTPAGKTALLDAVRGGTGFVGIHCATDTFHSGVPRLAPAGDHADPYVRMIGAEFIGHGKQQRARMICADPAFPGCAELKAGFELTEEWYAFKDLQKDLHVILVQETRGMDTAGKDGVYDRPPYPATWARRHGKGRVFYTGMGHREDVWTNPIFQSVLAGGLAWAMGEVQADVSPNVQKVTPGYAVISPEK
jgi:hypothetical protein